MTNVACIGTPGSFTGFWFEDRETTNDPTKMKDLLSGIQGVDPGALAALLNKQYSVTPQNLNGTDGYVVWINR